jgi:CheY-like chemotaxis protein
MQILIIEDEEIRQRWMCDVLEKDGHDVRLADTANIALDQLHETAFDLVFFDHDLGEPDAFMLPMQTRRQMGEPNGSRLLGMVLNSPRKYHRPKAVWVHSANPVGAENIASKCKSAQIPHRVEDYGTLSQSAELFLQNVTNLCQTIDT